MEENDLPLPDEFLCPITHELMTDPVITVDGQSYERTAIQEWFQRGSITSPATGAILTSNILVPNHALRNAIYKFHEHLPFLKVHLLEIAEMRQQLDRKEREIRDHIKHGLVLISVIDLTRISTKLQSSAVLLPPQSTGAKHDKATEQTVAAEEMKGGVDDITTAALSLINTNVIGGGLDQLKLSSEEFEAYDQSLIRSLIMNQQHSYEEHHDALLKQIQENISQQSNFLKETQLYQHDQKTYAHLLEERQVSVRQCTHEIALLNNTERDYEANLTAISQRYSEMAHDLMGQTLETSKNTLQALRQSVTSFAAATSESSEGMPTTGSFVMPKSPILQEYVRAVEQLNALRAEITLQQDKIKSYGIGDLQELLLNLQYKIVRCESCRTQLQYEERHLNEQVRECEHQLQHIASTHQDLSDALQWARKYSPGLTSALQVNQLTLPVLFLFFKLFCRLEISSGKNVEALVREGITPTRLRRWNCLATEVRHGGYSLAALKEGGYGPNDLKSAGWTNVELKNAGFTVQEFMKDGFIVPELRAIGYTAIQLKEAGFTTQQLREAGFTTQQLRAAGLT
jgi:hypothetical protein